MSDVFNTQWTATHKNDTHSTDDKILTAAKLHLGSLQIKVTHNVTLTYLIFILKI